jgi:mono/diheme cytochrome c family protein
MRTAILAAALTGLCAAAGQTAPPEPPKGAEGGKTIFRTICSSCHGTDGRGGGPVAESLRTKPPDLRRIAQRRGSAFPEDEIARYIDGRTRTPAHGTSEMPVWGDSLAKAVTDEQERERRIARAVEMLVAYLKTIQE